MHDDIRLDGKFAMSTYEIILEELLNAIKHVNETHVTITLQKKNGDRRISYLCVTTVKGFSTHRNYLELAELICKRGQNVWKHV